MTTTKADRQAAWNHFSEGEAASHRLIYWIETGVYDGDVWPSTYRVIALARLIADTREREREAIVAWLRPMHLELFTDTVADDIENREDEGADD